MFDFAWSEIALIGIVGLLFIGPKDMPVAIRTVTNLLKKGRKLAGEFQSHVDEMIREADLGEARDQFRQLRSFNVRGQIMKALDEDGAIKRTLDQRPFASSPVPLPAAGQVAVEPTARTMMPVHDLETRPNYGMPSSPWQPAGSTTESLPDEALAANDPAPTILPPLTANRLRLERAKPPAPRFVPPRDPRLDGVGRQDHGTRVGLVARATLPDLPHSGPS